MAKVVQIRRQAVKIQIIPEKEEKMKEAQHKTRFRFEQMADSPGRAHKLYVYDEVRAEGKFNWSTWDYEESETSAKYFRDQLDAIPDGEAIELHVNSAGGEVGEGVTIYNLLRQKSNAGSRLVGYVDGMAYSVAMDIIMACDEIHMGLGTSMFLHNPWAYACGNADQLRSMADQLDALADASRQLYLSRAKSLTEEELRQMMQKETMLAPDACLNYGFCDFVGEAGADENNPREEGSQEGAAAESAGGNAGGEHSGDGGKELEGDDNAVKQIRELRQQLYNQKQVTEMLRGLKKTSMSDTMQAAFRQLAK